MNPDAGAVPHDADGASPQEADGRSGALGGEAPEGAPAHRSGDEDPAPRAPRHARLDQSLPSLDVTVPAPALGDGGATDSASAPGDDEPLGFETLASPQADQPEDPDGPEEAPASRRRWPTVLLALAVALVGVYLAGAVAFMNVFMPNTRLNGEDVSLKSVGDVAQANAASVDSFGLSITGDGLDLQVSAADIKAKYDGSAYARSAIKQQRVFVWPLELLESHELAVESQLSYDAVRLSDLVGSTIDAHNKDAKDPEDASVSYNESSKRYEVKEEVPGTKLDKSATLDLVRAAIEEGGQDVELGSDELVKPELVSTDEKLVAAVDEANAALSATQDLVTDGKTVATVGEDEIRKWIKLGDDLSVSFDKEACTTWARGDLSQKLDSIGSKRSFTTPDGRKVSVEGGTYGWSIDGGEVAEAISRNVTAGEKGTIELSFLATAKSWNPGGNEWGDSFIEIDLGAQHVRYFVDGKVRWESDCVSGGMNTGKMHHTPTGVYFINSNMQSGNVELRGEIDPKTMEPEYISYVSYWMPFIDNSHALHDADWRSSFGGDIYKTSGSHGCVNLPPEKAKELYGMVSVGTVVVVHG